MSRSRSPSCSVRSWRRGGPTCTSRRVPRRWCGSTASSKPAGEYPPLTPRALQGMVYAILPQKLRERFEQELELDMSYSLPGRSRFRVNVFQQRDAVGAVFRVIPFEIKNVDDLGLPNVVMDLARFQRGFVVVTGPTGSGKSTTLAAMVDIVNRERAGHIMTVEDPIEFLHRHKSCVVNQREVGADTHGFAQALKHVLRQDPDVILVGEMRDLETIGTAITAAETGHLVFATLHTQDAPQTIDRIIDVFPPHQQQQVRVQLSTTLQGVVTQQLDPDHGRAGTCRRGRGARLHPRGAQPDPGGQDPPDLFVDAGGRPLRDADDGHGPRAAHQGGQVSPAGRVRAVPRPRGAPATHGRLVLERSIRRLRRPVGSYGSSSGGMLMGG